MATDFDATQLLDALLIPLIGAALISVTRSTARRDTSFEEETPVKVTCRGRRAARLGIAMGATTTAVALVGGGSAWAYFTGGSGHGTGVAATAAAPTVTVTTASLSVRLYPGSAADLAVALKNNGPGNSNGSWTVTGLTANGNVTGGNANCSPTNIILNTAATFSGNATISGSGGAGTVTFSKAVSMSGSAPNACQGLTFTVPVTVTGKMG